MIPVGQIQRQPRDGGAIESLGGLKYRYFHWMLKKRQEKKKKKKQISNETITNNKVQFITIEHYDFVCRCASDHGGVNRIVRGEYSLNNVNRR